MIRATEPIRVPVGSLPLVTLGACLAVSAAGAAAQTLPGPGVPAARGVTRPIALPDTDARWPRWSRTVLLLGGIAALDQPLRRGVADLRGGFGDRAATAGRWVGDWRRSAPWLAGGVLVAGTLAEGGRGVGAGGAVILGTLAGSMANETLNVIVGRGRPGTAPGAWRFRPLAGHASFPSGHTAYAFALAGAIDEATSGWVPAAAAYAMASLTGLSRIYDDRHWASDVVVGAIVGSWVSRRTTTAALRAIGLRGDEAAGPTGARDGLAGWRVRVEPIATPTFLGIQLTH